jgi:RNA polymerase sigma-70 factor (ECF subfamily)
MDAPELSAASDPASEHPGPTGQPPARTDAGEFEELFRRYEPGIGRFLAQMVSDRTLAADLTQETFASALGARNQLESIENPEAWLFRIARNCALQSFRKRSRAVNAIKRLSHERRDEAADPADAIELRDQLMRILKPDERSVLILRYVHGFSSQELAEIVGRSPEAIRKELSRSRRKLIESMDAPTTARAEKE